MKKYSRALHTDYSGLQWCHHVVCSCYWSLCVVWNLSNKALRMFPGICWCWFIRAWTACCTCRANTKLVTTLGVRTKKKREPESKRSTHLLCQFCRIYVGVIWYGISQECPEFHRKSTIDGSHGKTEPLVEPAVKSWDNNKQSQASRRSETTACDPHSGYCFVMEDISVNNT